MPRAQLGQTCRALGPALLLVGTSGTDGAVLDGARLLWALSGRESNFGANLVPRHEPAWDAGGNVYNNSKALQEFIEDYGSDGACSYGPLQAMAFNLQPYTPAQLAADPVLALTASVKYFNRYAIGHWHCTTLVDICNTWNAGNPKAHALPGYIEDVTRYYTGAVVP